MRGEENNKWMGFLPEDMIKCYHYYGVMSQEEWEKKVWMARGMGQDINKWVKRRWAAGVSDEEYFKTLKAKVFKGEHPEHMKKHPYYLAGKK